MENFLYMNLFELMKAINLAKLIESRKLENIDVVIDTELPYATVGQRPCIGVKYAGMGFDFEAGQFRIEPKEKLIAIRHDVPQNVIDWRGNYHCPKCEYMLSKNRKNTDIRFCSKCGQAVKWE